MPFISLNDQTVICMKCQEFMAPNPDRCGDPNCHCHQVKWVHFTTASDECELDSQK